jgi:hypothetical protein
MAGKLIYESESPVTQKPDAVEALAKYLNRPIENGVLDLGTVKLVKSNNGDAFYTTSAKACSCPSHQHRHMTCKHMKRFFAAAEAPAEGDSILAVVNSRAARKEFYSEMAKAGVV